MIGCFGPASALVTRTEIALDIAEVGCVLARVAGQRLAGPRGTKVTLQTEEVARQGQTFKLRLPFPRAAEDRKDVKTLIVQMTQTALKNPVVQEAMQAMVDREAEEEKAPPVAKEEWIADPDGGGYLRCLGGVPAAGLLDGPKLMAEC